MKSDKTNRHAIKTLRLILEELRGISDLLPAAYQLVGKIDEDGEIDLPESSIESEDVEIAVSALVSTVAETCDINDEPSSISELFTLILSSGDDLVSLAVNFEDCINGYSGELFGENLKLAQSYLDSIITVIEERLAK
ncbi:hypothetical protein [Granulicella tundricola]|uniref:hypothetical protein n=1 Tax=Granulicella tundricola TaxID=940615 RepID=UPI0005A092E0|nr:hypothetical protein [Granulicella tundricola]